MTAGEPPAVSVARITTGARMNAATAAHAVSAASSRAGPCALVMHRAPGAEELVQHQQGEDGEQRDEAEQQVADNRRRAYGQRQPAETAPEPAVPRSALLAGEDQEAERHRGNAASYVDQDIQEVHGGLR